MDRTNLKPSLSRWALILLGRFGLRFSGGSVAAGCTAHVRPASGSQLHAHARVVKIPAGHRHTSRCGHYRHGARWYHVKGHVHGRGCGHVRRGGVWILVR